MKTGYNEQCPCKRETCPHRGWCAECIKQHRNTPPEDMCDLIWLIHGLGLVNGKKPESSTLKSKKERRNKSICLEILEPFAAKKAAGLCRLLFSNCIKTVGRGFDWNFTS